MLGYVRCSTGNLLVKHHRLYQAMYCGLCHSIGKNTAKALLPFLSYDFVFLAFLRLLATGEEIRFEKQHCLLHPFSRNKQRVCDNEALRFCAAAALFLTYEKMKDDRIDGDSSFGRRFLVTLWSPLLSFACKRQIKRDPKLAQLALQIADAMTRGRALETGKAGIDAMSASFGEILSQIFSFGLEGKEARILASIGDHMGRFIYTLDALDDLECDEKNASFNPFLIQYGSADQVRKHFPELDLVLSFSVEQMMLALALLEGEEAYSAICRNVISLGLPEASGKIFKSYRENVNERSL